MLSFETYSPLTTRWPTCPFPRVFTCSYITVHSVKVAAAQSRLQSAAKLDRERTTPCHESCPFSFFPSDEITRAYRAMKGWRRTWIINIRMKLFSFSRIQEQGWVSIWQETNMIWQQRYGGGLRCDKRDKRFAVIRGTNNNNNNKSLTSD